MSIQKEISYQYLCIDESVVVSLTCKYDIDVEQEDSQYATCE